VSSAYAWPRPRRLPIRAAERPSATLGKDHMVDASIAQAGNATIVAAEAAQFGAATPTTGVAWRWC
jgi:hypothetical protein